MNNLNQFYLELSRSKRYNEEFSYDRIGKDYRLLDVIHNKEKYFNNDKKLIIGTLFDTEPKILNSFLDDKEVEDIYIGNLAKKYHEDYNLLVPGFIPHIFVSEIYKNYSNILFLAYDGFNRNFINQQIERIKNPSFTDE